jgi:hypothetical protein
MKLPADTATRLLDTAINEANNMCNSVVKGMRRFAVARNALSNSKSITEVEEHFLEAAMHLETASENFKRASDFVESLDVDALYLMARQSKELRDVTDEEMKANIEKRVAKGKSFVQKAHANYKFKQQEKLLDDLADNRRETIHARALWLVQKQREQKELAAGKRNDDRFTRTPEEREEDRRRAPRRLEARSQRPVAMRRTVIRRSRKAEKRSKRDE